MSQSLVSPDLLSLVDTTLNDFFVSAKTNAHQIDHRYERLWDALHSLIRSGGKRLRPQMTLLAYQAFGGEEESLIIPIAAAQELLHFSLLIHDDVIDRDYVRYGTANVAGQYKLHYSKFVSSEDSLTHYAHSAAILGGDLMLSGAHQLIARSHLPAASVMQAQQILSAGVFEVAGGELLDTELSFTPYTNGDAITIARYKTASYSFIAPLATGARLAGASDQHCDTLTQMAESLGIAYQLADDLLGVFGEEAQTGKSNVGDIVEGKRTLLVENALTAFSEQEHATFMMAFGNPTATALEIDTAKKLLESSGAREKTSVLMNEYSDQANSLLDQLSLKPEYHERFLQLINQVTNRVS